jgi:hypothetical protein
MWTAKDHACRAKVRDMRPKDRGLMLGDRGEEDA